MRPRFPRITVLLSVLALSAGTLAACGEEEEHVRREGLAVEMAGLTYNVFITRQLNTHIEPDRSLFPGPEAPPGTSYYGVFVHVCNESHESRQSATTFKIVDTQGNEYHPVQLPEDNVFAYRPGTVRPEDCVPTEGSPAALSSTGGAMLLFRLETQAVENRPLELEIEAPESEQPPQPLTQLEGALPVEPGQPARSREVGARETEETQPAGGGQGGGGAAGHAGGQRPAEAETNPREHIRIELDI